MQIFDTAREAAYALRPDQPVYCFMPQVLTLNFRGASPLAAQPAQEEIV